jgi:hypothetical protein
MIAMLIFAVIAVASLGFVTTSLTATALSRTETVAKNLNQERLERMRNLPYFQHANVSSVPDLLDTYYTSSSAPAGSTASDGFVAAAGARDTAKGDPAAGPFYRRVFQGPGPVGFTQRVTAQFMSAAITVMPAPVFVSTSTGPTGLPPSPTISVRVTTLWSAPDGRQRRFIVESQIADAAAKFPLVTLQARLSMLRVAGVLPGPQELLSEAGVLSLDGSLSTTAVASAKAQGVFASVANGPREDGANGSVSAPPSTTLSVASVGPKTLISTSEVAAFSGTSVTALAVSSDGGQPVAGTETTPVNAILQGNGLGNGYFRASNRPDTTSRLGLIGPAVVATETGCGASCAAVRASGHVTSVGGASHSATAGLTGAVKGTVALLPTATAPDGLIQLTLSSFSLSCVSAAGASPPGKVILSYAGTLTHRTYDPTTLIYGYRAPITISSTNVSDPLATVDLQTIVGVDAAGSVLRLADYVQSWSSLSSTAVNGFTVLAGNGTAASINVPGVFTFDSKPLRPEPDSTVGVQLGAASCLAGDIR